MLRILLQFGAKTLTGRRHSLDKYSMHGMMIDAARGGSEGLHVLIGIMPMHIGVHVCTMLLYG